MRFVKFLVIIIFSLSCAIFGSLISVSAQDASVVRATEVNGTVTKNNLPLKEGDVIERDDRIESKGNSSAVLTWSNGSMVEIYPETILVVRGVVFEEDKKMEKTLLTLEKGRTFAKAQTPEHLFTHFEIKVGNVPIISQGAEFAIKYDEGEKKSTVWSLIGRVVIEMGTKRERIEDGQQVVLRAGEIIETPAPILEKTKESLMKTSKRLGGSLLIEETVSTGGPLKVKIGGVRNRRGAAPYTVNFKAIIGGGSGNLKSLRWDFGDGESNMGKEAQHTFTQGIYVVVVHVEDENGQKATAQISISVEEDCAC